MTTFRRSVRRALADPILQVALDRNAERRRAAWGPAFDSLPNPGDVRRRAAEIRRRCVEDLPSLLATFVDRARASGIVVHQASSGPEACHLIVELLHQRSVRKVVKAKSMVTEEIGLNRALTAAGMDVLESDLGEFIVQLRGEPPAHITAPAIHLRREEVARTFETHLGMPYSTDVEVMTAAARQALRSKFLEAEAGISGVNFGVAETGTLCLVTNEGNGRMVTTLPRLHIAVMGVERIVGSLADLSVMLEVLPRAGTGQRLTSYVTLLQRPRASSDPDGPDERHVVLVDNGRLAMRGSPLGETLACIRCGACLNACPVYQEIGGHAYGNVYPGPIGSVVAPGLWGTATFGHLATASTLCAACRDACPVGIDLPALLLRVRAERARKGEAPTWLRLAMRSLAWSVATPEHFRFALRWAAAASRLAPKRGGWIRRLPPPVHGWTAWRDFPPFAARPFRRRWVDLGQVEVARIGESEPPAKQGLKAIAPPVMRDDRRHRFVAAAREVGCEVVECSRNDLADAVRTTMERAGTKEALSWGRGDSAWTTLLEQLQASGISLLEPFLSPGPQGEDRLARFSAAPVGLTAAAAGLADAGTIVVPSGADRSQLASLLPPVHLAVLAEGDIHESLETWLPTDGARWLANESAVVLITGPSRTADIELTLTVGVHGPKKLILFLVEDPLRDDLKGALRAGHPREDARVASGQRGDTSSEMRASSLSGAPTPR